MSTSAALEVTLKSSFYPTPSKGFLARMAVLITLNAVNLVLCSVYFTAIAIETKRRGRNWWFTRLVSRPSGKYIATHQGASLAVLGFISTAIIIGHIVAEVNVYAYQGSQAHIAAWRAFSYVPVFVLGWTISWAGLQSFLLTPDYHGLSANAANFLFVGGGICILLGLFIGAGFSSAAGVALNDEYTLLLTAIQSEAPISSLMTEYQNLLRAGAHYRSVSIALGVIFACTPFLTAIVNLGSLGLVRILRRQISYNLRQLRQPITPSCLPPTPASLSASKNEEVGILGWGKKSGIPGRSEVRVMANQVGNEEGEQARKIVMLRRVADDLMVVGMVIGTLSLLFAGLGMWIMVRTFQGTLTGDTASWSTLETALFVLEWIFSITLLITLSYLIFSSFPLPKKVEKGLATTEMVSYQGPGGSASLASFGAMFRRGGVESHNERMEEGQQEFSCKGDEDMKPFGRPPRTGGFPPVQRERAIVEEGNLRELESRDSWHSL